MGRLGLRSPVVWSPVEVDYLKNHLKDPIDQLCIALSKSRNAVEVKKREIVTGKPAVKQKRKTSIGKRADLGVFMRSGWEANVARWFNYMGYKWEYEPETFFFEAIKHGTVSYLPDFKVDIGGNTFYIEVKGFLTPQGKTAIRRFQKYYPAEASTLIAITGGKKTKATEFFEKRNITIMAYMSELKKEYSHVIPEWE